MYIYILCIYYVYIYIYYVYIYTMYIYIYIIYIYIYNVNPGLINPQTAVELGGVPFMYQIVTIWRVPPQLINQGLLIRS